MQPMLHTAMRHTTMHHTVMRHTTMHQTAMHHCLSHYTLLPSFSAVTTWRALSRAVCVVTCHHLPHCLFPHLPLCHDIMRSSITAHVSHRHVTPHTSRHCMENGHVLPFATTQTPEERLSRASYLNHTGTSSYKSVLVSLTTLLG